MTDYSTKRADRATLLKLIGKIAKKKTIFNPQRAEGTHRAAGTSLLYGALPGDCHATLAMTLSALHGVL